MSLPPEQLGDLIKAFTGANSTAQFAEIMRSLARIEAAQVITDNKLDAHIVSDEKRLTRLEGWGPIAAIIGYVLAGIGIAKPPMPGGPS